MDDTLIERLEKIIKGGIYDSGWGVWAITPFTPQSSARSGLLYYENGGLLDDKKYFANNEEIINAAYDYCGGNPMKSHFDTKEIAEAVFEKIMSFLEEDMSLKKE